MKAVSDQVEGTFNLDSKTFTVAPTETPAVNPPAVDPPAEGTGN